MNKPNILFVDDEQAILDSIHRAFRKYKSEWNLYFVDNAKSALEYCAKNSVDVVVTDMCMPEMDGAELLQKLRKDFPDTIRIVLTGHADQDMILRTVMSAHQYLTKPYQNDLLKSQIGESLKLRQLLDGDIREIVSNTHHLPSLPSLYQEILTCLESKSVSLEQITDIIIKDIAMSAKILHIINSAFFGMRKEVSSLHEAINYLGLDIVMALILNAKIFSTLDDSNIDKAAMTSLWDRAYRIGVMAKKICKHESHNEQVATQAMIAGLLLEVGKIVLMVNYPEKYQQCDSLADEKAMFNCTHSEIGAYLLSTWGLPDPIVNAILYIDNPLECYDQAFSPLTSVYIANKLDKGDFESDSYLKKLGFYDISRFKKR